MNHNSLVVQPIALSLSYSSYIQINITNIRLKNVDTAGRIISAVTHTGSWPHFISKIVLRTNQHLSSHKVTSVCTTLTANIQHPFHLLSIWRFISKCWDYAPGSRKHTHCTVSSLTDLTMKNRWFRSEVCKSLVPGPLSLMWWHLVFVGSQYGSCLTSNFGTYNFRVFFPPVDPGLQVLSTVQKMTF